MGGVSTFLLKIYVVIYMDESRVIYCVPTVYPELTWFDLNLNLSVVFLFHSFKLGLIHLKR